MTTPNESWKNEETEQLIKAILELKTPDEARLFLRDLLTNQEIVELGKRWKTARLLYQGRPYSEIEQQTGLSSATIARISKWLHEGTGGYRMMLERLYPSSKKNLS